MVNTVTYVMNAKTPAQARDEIASELDRLAIGYDTQGRIASRMTSKKQYLAKAETLRQTAAHIRMFIAK